jgi:hypothetical protein
MSQTKDAKKALLKLGLLEGNEEEYVETLGGADGEPEGPVEGSISELLEGTQRSKMESSKAW